MSIRDEYEKDVWEIEEENYARIKKENPNASEEELVEKMEKETWQAIQEETKTPSNAKRKPKQRAIRLAAGIAALVAVISHFVSKANEGKKAAQEFYKSLAENAYKPIATIEELSLKWNALGDDLNESYSVDPLMAFEPGVDNIMQKIVPMFITNIVYQALLEAVASELAARMTAMSSATNNADEMIRILTIDYNKARQAAITQEISEVVSGADALKN